MKRDEPISKIAVLIALAGSAVFWWSSGDYLTEWITYGFTEPKAMIQDLIIGIVLFLLFAGVAIGIQYLSDIKWLLKNRIDLNA